MKISLMKMQDNVPYVAIVKLGTGVLWPAAATGVTVFLFLLMAFLITPQGEVPQDVPDDIVIDITRPQRDEHSTGKERVNREKPKLEDDLPPPTIPQIRPHTIENSGPVVEIPDIRSGKRNVGLSLDRRATPIVRIPPQYPQSALVRGTEGWVLVEFTITKTGTVTGARVVEAEPASIFNRETLRAISRWRYQPKVENGQPVAQYGMREIFHFRIEDAN